MVVSVITVNAQDGAAKRELHNLLSGYFEMKNALTKDNVAKTAESAKKVSAIIAQFPVKTLTPEQLDAWKKEVPVMKKTVADMQSGTTLAAQREPFGPFSDAIIRLVKGLHMNEETLYVQYCPMVKKSWLNEVEAVQNPFYGSKMYSCGKVSETLTK